MTIAKTGRVIGAALFVGLATGAIAQVAGDTQVPQTSLNLPRDVQVFGTVDPNVRKPTAVVNGEIVTGTDVDQRLALILVANGEARLSDEDRQRLRLQVLRNIIDETLQIQEARANEITVTDDEIRQSFARVARNFGRTPDTLAGYLGEVGSSERSLKRQIEGELAWNRLLRRRVQPFVNVGEEEVRSIIDRLEAAKGTEEYHLGEIYLSAPPGSEAQAGENARRLMAQLRDGSSFAAYARQFSEASTASVGGDLGWVRAAQIPGALAQAAQGMAIGQLAGPVAVPGGLSILYMVDKRQVLTADPRDAKLSLRQLSVKFPDNIPQAQAQQRVERFAQATKAIRGCGAVDAVAQQTGGEVVDNDAVRVRDLPPQLQGVMLQLQVGEATPPFGSPEDGVRVLVLCGRDDPQVASAPSFNQIQEQLEEERVNRRAQRYLRDLRRDAVVDYR